MMRKLFVLLGALALFALAPGLALATECSTLLGTMNADNVTLYAGSGNSCLGATFKPMGVIYTTTAKVSTATGTTEQTLATYSLPGGSLDTAGRKIRIKVSFSAGATGNNKTFKLYFGTSSISSGVLTTNAKNGYAEMVVTDTGSKTQIVYANMLVDTTWITPTAVTNSTEDDTAAIVIKFTGTDGTSAAADIVMNDFSIEYMN